MTKPLTMHSQKKALLTVCVSLLTLGVLVLTGCPKPDAPSPAPGNSGETLPGLTSDEGLTLPLQPAGKTASESDPTDLTLLRLGEPTLAATGFGKVADEAIPMVPVADLVGQVDEYVERIGKNLEDLDGTVNYKNDADTIVRDSNGLALVALALGMSKDDSKYKKAASEIIKAAMELAKVEKFDDTKKAFDALKTALTSEGDPASLKWIKVADLPPVMKAVPNLSSTLTRLTNAENKLKRTLGKNPERIYGALGALAAISQGSIANVGETTKPDAVADWKKECEQFRDAAIKANAAAHGYADGTVKYDEYWTTFKAMTDTCDHCHQTFYPSAVGKNE